MGWGWVWCVVVVGVCLFGNGGAEKLDGYSRLFDLEVEDRTSFLSAAGSLVKPIRPSDMSEGMVSQVHFATLFPNQVRGNHLHPSFRERITLVHGRFYLRAATKLGGSWVVENHIFEIDASLATPSSPTSQYDYLPYFRQTEDLVVSSSPITIDLHPKVCHGLAALNASKYRGSQAGSGPAYFGSYYVWNEERDGEEGPDRDTCRSQEKALLTVKDLLRHEGRQSSSSGGGLKEKRRFRKERRTRREREER